MNKTYTICPIYNNYTNEVIDLITTIQQQEFNIPITVHDQPDLLDIEANYHTGGGNFLGAFAGEELVGTIALINIGYNAGTVRKMFIKDGHRGTGLAQQFLDTLLEYSRQKQITHLYLGTSAVLKAAHKFYERNGFVLTPVEQFPSYFPRMAVDTMFYALRLS